MDPRIDGNVLFCDGGRAIGAAIVDEDDLDVAVGLLENAANRTLERSLRVIEGQYDADLWVHFFSLSRAKKSLNNAAHSFSRMPDTTAKRWFRRVSSCI